MKWSGGLPEEGVLELAPEGGRGFTESMRARWALGAIGGRCWGGTRPQEQTSCCFPLSLGFLLSFLFPWACCPQHLLHPLAGVKRPSQPVLYFLGLPSDLRILQVGFLKQIFSIYSVPGIKGKNRFREHVPHFSDETWDTDSGRHLSEVPQLQIQCPGLSMPSVNDLKLV